MHGRFVIGLLMLFSFTQGYEGNKLPLGISEENIVNYLKELNAELQNDLRHIKEDIETFEDKIKISFKEINVPQLIANLEKKIEDITAESEINLSGAIKCLAKQQREVDLFVKTANEGNEKCSGKMNPLKGKITKEVTTVTIIAQEMDTNITIGIWKCYYNNLSHPEEVLGCLLKLVVPTSITVDAASRDIQTIGVRCHQLAEEASQNVSKCVSQVKKELIQQEDIILEPFKKCIS